MSVMHDIAKKGHLAAFAVRLTWEASPALTLILLVLVLLQAALSPLQLVLSKEVIDHITLALGSARHEGAYAVSGPLDLWIAFTAAVLAAGQLIRPCLLTLESLAGDRLAVCLTEQVICAANRWQGLARFEDPALADDLERARSGAHRAGLDLLLSGLHIAVLCCTEAGLALVLLRLSSLVLAVVLLATLPKVVREWAYRQRTRTHLYSQTPAARRLRYSRDVMLTREDAKDVRLYGLGPFFRRQYDAAFERSAGELNRLRLRLLGPIVLANALAAAASGGVYIYVAWQAAQGRLGAGDLVLYGGAVALFQSTLTGIGHSAALLSRELAFLPSLYRVLTLPPDLVVDAPRPVPCPIRQGIVCEDVTFTYPGRAGPVLRGLLCSIRPGETVALVGLNGAGKTTMIKLLLRLYDPTSGRILLDGVDLRDYDLADLRRAMGVLFQDFVRYDLTAGENIAVGDLTAVHDTARLWAAADKSGAREAVERLPEGLDTLLGLQFGGRDLSGGEWQKIALARAFLRDSPILILDEPTAALDVQTEYDLYTRFTDLTREKMTVLVSHRLSTVRMADRILYLADGCIQEEGSHTDLLARDGAYARLYRLQAAQYTPAEVRA